MQQRLFLLKCQQTILCNPGNSWRIRKQLFWKETALLMFWPIEHLNQGNWRTETSSLSEASGIALAHTAMWTHPPLQASRKLAQTVNKKNFQSAKKKKKKKKKGQENKTLISLLFSHWVLAIFQLTSIDPTWKKVLKSTRQTPDTLQWLLTKKLLWLVMVPISPLSAVLTDPNCLYCLGFTRIDAPDGLNISLPTSLSVQSCPQSISGLFNELFFVPFGKTISKLDHPASKERKVRWVFFPQKRTQDFHIYIWGLDPKSGSLIAQNCKILEYVLVFRDPVFKRISHNPFQPMPTQLFQQPIRDREYHKVHISQWDTESHTVHSRQEGREWDKAIYSPLPLLSQPRPAH